MAKDKTATAEKKPRLTAVERAEALLKEAKAREAGGLQKRYDKAQAELTAAVAQVERATKRNDKAQAEIDDIVAAATAAGVELVLTAVQATEAAPAELTLDEG